MSTRYVVLRRSLELLEQGCLRFQIWNKPFGDDRDAWDVSNPFFENCVWVLLLRKCVECRDFFSIMCEDFHLIIHVSTPLRT